MNSSIAVISGNDILLFALVSEPGLTNTAGLNEAQEELKAMQVVGWEVLEEKQVSEGWLNVIKLPLRWI